MAMFLGGGDHKISSFFFFFFFFWGGGGIMSDIPILGWGWGGGVNSRCMEKN